MAITLASPPFSAGAGGGIKPEINVTPLVDVVLVLLIIFMVIAPQLEHGERVELPGIVNVDKTSKLDAMTLIVTSQGRYYLEKEPVEASDLGAKLTAAHEAAPEKRVVIKSDRGSKYATVRAAFAACQKIGFPGVALMVDETKKETNHHGHEPRARR